MPYLIVGDPAYLLSRWLLKGFSFTSQITKQQDSFNSYLNKNWVLIEIAFGRLKGRWRRLTKKIDADVKFAPTIIMARGLLHNIVEASNEDFSEKWLRIVENCAEMYPQPDPYPQDDHGILARDDSCGEKIRNALLEITNKLPILPNIFWKLRRYWLILIFRSKNL